MNIRTVDNHCYIFLQTGTHEFRPRSMDGVIDSGVSLNGDTSSCPDTNLHTQNQQVSKEYIHKEYIHTYFTCKQKGSLLSTPHLVQYSTIYNVRSV